MLQRVQVERVARFGPNRRTHCDTNVLVYFASGDLAKAERAEAAIAARGTRQRRTPEDADVLGRHYFSGKNTSATASCSGTAGKKLSRWQ